MKEAEPPVGHDASNPSQPEARSALTRTRLLDATYRILRNVGHEGLRSGAVSDVSGVSRGGLLHHFPTKELLIAATFEYIVVQQEEASWDRIRSCPDDALLEGIVDDARSRFLTPSYKVMLDILVASAKEKPLAETREALDSRFYPTARQGWARRLEETGLDLELADRVTLFLWNMVKGLAVRNLVHVDEALCDRVIALGLNLARRRCSAMLKAA